MFDSRTTGVLIATILGVAATSATIALGVEARPTGEPLAVDATPLFAIQDESSLSIRGIHGQIKVETRKGRELRVVSREPGQGGAERPIGLWQEGTKLTLAPAPGDTGGPRQLSVEVPPNFAIAVDADDSYVAVLSAGGPVELRGKEMRATIHDCSRTISADLEGGTLNLLESSEATLKLRGTVAQITRMTGNVRIASTSGRIAVTKVAGATNIESEETELTVKESASLFVKGRKGEVTVERVTGLMDFQMTGAALHVTEGGGETTVVSDALVELQKMQAAVHAEMSGGVLRGRGFKAAVDVRGRNAELVLEYLESSGRIQGEGLRARLADVMGDLGVDLVSSDVVVWRAASLVAKLERGSLTSQQVVGAVQATILQADAHILEGSGAVTLDIDGGDAEVSWATLPGDKGSELINKSGSITVTLPPSAFCRVDASSKYGRVDSEFPTVKVSQDQSAAQGSINGGSRPLVHILAIGDVHLKNLGANPSPAPDATEADEPTDPN